MAKKISIVSLEMINFKGVKQRKIEFSAEETNISGDNGTGKTTVADAFLWGLFGKDSQDKKDFTVKTIDPETRKVISKLDHEVILTLLVNDKSVVFRRVLVEKWTTRRGSEIAEFTGHETNYYHNDVPMSMKEYADRVSELCTEDLFRFITNAYYFPTLNWAVQRKMLFSMVGEMSDHDVLEQYPAFQELFDRLQGKSLDDFKKQIASQKKKAKEDLEKIPSRIDEVQRSIVEADPTLGEQQQKLQKDLDVLDMSIGSATKATEEADKEFAKVMQRIRDAKEKQQTIVHEVRMSRNATTMQLEEKKANMQGEVETTRLKVNLEKSHIKTLTDQQQNISNRLQALRDEFADEKAKTFEIDTKKLLCPTCQREFNDSDQRREDMEARFNLAKAEALTKMNEKGGALKEGLAENIKRIDEANTKLHALEVDLKSKEEEHGRILIPVAQEVDPTTLPEWNEIQTEIDRLSGYDKPNPNTNELIERRNNVYLSLKGVGERIAVQNTNGEKKARIEELEKSMRTLSQQIASYDKEEFAMQEFTKAKIDANEGKVNGLFPTVRFKLFNYQINGGEEETCIATIDGVPYPDLNTASKVWAGIEIINALSDHNQVYAPIFIDNRESVSLIPPVKTQVINLYKTSDKKLVIT